MLRVREQADPVDGLADGPDLPEVFHQLVDDVLWEVMLEGFPDLLLLLLRVKVIPDHAAEESQRSLEKERDRHGVPEVARLELIQRHSEIETAQARYAQRRDPDMEIPAEEPHDHAPEDNDEDMGEHPDGLHWRVIQDVGERGGGDLHPPDEDAVRLGEHGVETVFPLCQQRFREADKHGLVPQVDLPSVHGAVPDL